MDGDNLQYIRKTETQQSLANQGFEQWSWNAYGIPVPK